MQSQTIASAPRPVDLHQQLTELIGIIRRRPGLIAASLLVAFMLGALYYLKAPRTYESRAEMMFYTKHYSLSGTNESDSPIYEKTLETHAGMMCKPLIVERAVNDYELSKLATLSDAENVVTTIIANLSAHLQSDNSSIIQLTYRSSDPNDAQTVVDAVAKTYRDYLKEDNESVGRETVTLIGDANDNLLLQLRKNQEQHQEFQRHAPLMWREGRGVNIHHERQALIESDRQQLMNKRTVLTAKIETLKQILTSGAISRDALYYEAMQSLSLNQEGTSWRAFQMAERQQFAEREAVRGLANSLVAEYVRLKVQESEFLDEYGDGHPKVESTSKRMVEIKVMLDQIFQNQFELSSGVLLGSNLAGDDDTDYVAIYMKKLEDEKIVLDNQIEAFNDEFVKEQLLANQLQEFLLKDQAFRNEQENTQRLFDVVVARLKQVNAVSAYGGDTMTIVAPAIPGEQVAPSLLLVIIGSVLLGSVGGLSLAWYRERSEDMFHSLSEVREALSAPVIGRIPQFSANHLVQSVDFSDFDPVIVALHNDMSPIAESFRALRTSLFFGATGQKNKVIQITSPLPSDGKSTVTANLAVAVAKSGKRVLVLDADFRRPALTRMLGVTDVDQPGLAGIIAGKTTFESSVMATKVDNLHFLPVCQLPTQPSEMLSTPEFAAVINKARELYDVVLIDTPPVLPVTDPCVVAALVDGVILTIRLRKGVQEAASRAMETLRDINANILGVVVNGWQPQHATGQGRYGYGYGYGYGYTHNLGETNGHGPEYLNGNAGGSVMAHEASTGSKWKAMTEKILGR